jgi:RNA polymerase sigma factor (sigma-70 family)
LQIRLHFCIRGGVVLRFGEKPVGTVSGFRSSGQLTLKWTTNWGVKEPISDWIMEEDNSARLAGIFEAHYDEVVAYCARRIGRAEAEDVASEAFVVASRRAEEIEWETVLPWLFAVARGVLANRRRSIYRLGRVYGRMAGLAVAPSDSPDEVVIRNAEARKAIAALHQLRPSDREILMLAAWEELTGSQIALSLGISVAATEKRLERAKHRLSRILDPSANGAGAPSAAVEKGGRA